MSSLVSVSLSSTIKLISELVKLLCGEFKCQGVFDEVPSILVDHVNKIVLELKYLEKEWNFVQENCLLVERTHRLEKTSMLMVQRDFLESQKECQRLGQVIAVLRENERITNETLKRAEEINVKVFEMLFEKDKIVGNYEKKLKCVEEKGEELKEEICALKGQIVKDGKLIDTMKSEQSEKDQVIRTYEEKLKHFDDKWQQAERENQDLNSQILSADQMIDEMKAKLSEKDQSIGNYEKKLKCVEEKGEQLKEEIHALKGQVVKEGKSIDTMKSEQSKAEDEKNKIVGALDKEIRKLKNELLGKDQVIRMYEEELKCFDEKGQQAERENQNLNSQILRADQMIDEMKAKAKLSKANDQIDKLKNQVLQKDQVVGMYQVLLKCVNGRVGELECENRDLNCHRLAANQTIDEIICLQSETDLEKDQILEKDLAVGMYEDELKCLKQELQDLRGKKLIADQTNAEIKFALSKADFEKKEIISELNKKIDKLKNQILEKDKSLGEYEKKLKCFYTNLEQVEKDIQGLKGQKVADDQTIEKMRCEQVSADQIIERMKMKQPKSNDTLEELRRQNLEASKTVEALRSQVLDHHATTESENVLDSKGERRNLKFRITMGTGKNGFRVVRRTMRTVPSACNSTKRTSSGIRKMGSKIQRGASDLHAEKPHRADSSGYGSPAETNGADLENKCKRFKQTDTKIQGVASGKNGESPLQARLPEHGPQAENIVLDQENELKILKGKDFIDSNDKQTSVRSTSSSHAHEILGRQNNIGEKVNSDDGDSTDSDDSTSTGSNSESCSDTAITDILADIRCQKLCNNWMSVDEMRKDLEEDIEFCMNAVCVLYRHKISNHGEPGQFDDIRGSDLVKYLIDGDPKHRLKKLLSEVKQERPDDLGLCWQLASDNCDKLFMIYRGGKDPLFKLI